MKNPEYFKPTRVLKLMTASSIVKLKIPPKRQLWGKRIQSGQTGMVYAPRAAGKTFFCLGLATAMSAAVEFLGLASKKPRNVVYLDGEMDLLSVQHRLRVIAQSLGVEIPKNLRLFSPELFTDLLPSINTPEGQAAIDEMIGTDYDVLFIDNYSAFNDSGSENAEAWAPAMRWILDKKRAGKTVIVVHHAGKASGKQRGTSKHEDALDWMIALTPVPSDDSKSSDLTFVLEWKKSRHLPMSEMQPITATMSTAEDGKLSWHYEDGNPTDPRCEEAVKLKKAGKSNAEIGKKFDVNASTVSRWLKKERA